MISIRLKTVLFVEAICLPLCAQRDFSLVQDKNFWLTSGNAAALTTLADSSISTGSACYRYDGGGLRSVSGGRHENTFGADVRSYNRLSEHIVAFGSITYRNASGTEMAGSMLFPTEELKPFDLVEETAENAGDKHAETFNIVGSIGWKVWQNLSIGAKIDYTAGNYAKHRDLRHSNTLMNLDSRLNVFYSLGSNDGIGAGLLYRRSTETMQFNTYGTTDKVFKTLVDYANGYGETETFGVDGFTNGGHEQPLFSEYTGVALQGGLCGFFVDFSYMHRTGYYGRQSQYTVSHSRHHGDVFLWHLRQTLSQKRPFLCMADLWIAAELLTTERNNYRRVTSDENTSVTFYEYYTPTKMSDKAQQRGRLAITGYWLPAGEIYLWHAVAGADCLLSKQTAYIFPDNFTDRQHIVSPFVQARRSFLLANSALLSAQAGYAMRFGSVEEVEAHAGLSCEMPLRNTAVRPSISMRYDFRTATGGVQRGLTRNVVEVALGATF